MVPRIRLYQDSDKNDILNIVKLIWDEDDFLPRALDSWASDPKSHFFVVEENESVIACANLILIENGQVGWLEGLRVHPRARRKGIGSMIVQHIVSMSEILGANYVRLYTYSEYNAAIGLYKRMGISELFHISVSWSEKLSQRELWHSQYIFEQCEHSDVIEVIAENPSYLQRKRFVQEREEPPPWIASSFTQEGIMELDKSTEFFLGKKDSNSVSLSLGILLQDIYGSQW